MRQSKITIRKIRARDQRRWRTLFDAYNRFYGREPSRPLTTYTWGRIMDTKSPVYSIGAVDARGAIIGIANYVLQESTTTIRPACYLQDLYVDEAQRGEGVGKQLIDWLIAEMKSKGWAHLYWHTKETNYRARGLYDKYTPHSGFVKYIIKNEI